mmetsp:Transcript_34579/g.87460  ORF Transcript_34579/g.87460 Transcript_34579/m.87460 type:complete len:266 (-) Transcript_34579:262-1059(-)|eukprot:CAMPEP_0202865306 /NCGR_PEP_ID=MMETSP1391-20130828/5619_1 /ASSEMBLY_ACC=CAM_ASM_000867 /TAXON_ID=1034604 /ORGANISM="Chlamydomonas leiostraca, Strain SAG 11-49" /LENGTH=265 /DNA_ID=CAMNT_0049545129 /DNA_START=21 /DNA_END=818 /DNA_ORIENTATION=+
MQSSIVQSRTASVRVPAAASRAAVHRVRCGAAVTPVKATPAYDLDPDNASILVAGGGGVALQVTRRLKNMGSWVWQLQRNDSRRKEIEGMMAIVAKGDALNKVDVAKVYTSIEDVDAVVCTLGGTTQDPRVDSEGSINMIHAAMEKGVKKFILVTSLGCGSSKGAIQERVYDALKPVLLEKDKAEAELMAQDKMAWVIIRPGGLSDDPATGSGVLTESTSTSGYVTRADVAQCVVKALFSKKADGKILSCVDKSKATGTTEEFKL